jgi:hypothetical protein
MKRKSIYGNVAALFCLLPAGRAYPPASSFPRSISLIFFWLICMDRYG